jgi:tRNA (adenine22-N1)-methyltransferase
MIKLGKRLEALDAMVDGRYDHIWDCCCDHGLLGMNLLARKAAPTVHFVDVAASLVESLNAKLTKHFVSGAQVGVTWQTHCADAASLNLDTYPGKQLVIIAGVGGDLTLNIVSLLSARLKTTGKLANVDFLLCPLRQHYLLRNGLREEGFKVKNEILVEENKRIYEILFLTADQTLTELKTITTTGEQIWLDANNPTNGTARKYADLILSHYSKRALSGKAHAIQALHAYQATIQLRIPD